MILVSSIIAAKADTPSQTGDRLGTLIVAAFNFGYECAADGKTRGQCAKLLLDNLDDKWGVK